MLSNSLVRMLEQSLTEQDLTRMHDCPRRVYSELCREGYRETSFLAVIVSGATRTMSSPDVTSAYARLLKSAKARFRDGVHVFAYLDPLNGDSTLCVHTLGIDTGDGSVVVPRFQMPWQARESWPVD